MYYQRTATIDLPPRQSAFLWGARQTGKSTLLRERFQGSVFYDLLDSEVMLRFASRPSLLGEELDAQPAETLAKPVIVDEIQKVPALLDEVHRLIESRDLAFILCGSSARKLKRAGTNLLGGRAWRFELFPLTWAEVPDFDLLQALNRGMLPSIYTQRQYQRSLAAYVRDYLVHEVFNEALTRNVAAFSRFFDALAFCHGELLNFAAIARDCAVDAKTVKTYFEILSDTLVGHLIYPFRRAGSRQAISAAPKFYLFDIGVAGQVCRRTLTQAAGSEFGRAFEHFILLEIIAARGYREQDLPIEFWRTKGGLEVDFVLGRGAVAVEVKSRVRPRDLRPMKAFREEFSPGRSIVVTAEQERRVVDGIEVMPYSEFLELLHGGDVI